jgi:malate dehydrogenase (oxaloacetate-decarboxylating)
VDINGLVVDDGADDFRRDLAWPAALAESAGLGAGSPRDLEAVVRVLRPTVLIGVSGATGAFTEPVVREMARGVARPVIFPLSNPTSQAEATPADLLAWTDGRALVATGSPFAPVTWRGSTVRVGQGNNVFIFPGVGLGAMVAEAREITNGMFAAAAECLAAQVSEDDLAAGSLFPPIADLRRVTAHIAEAVVREATEHGLGRPIAGDEIPRAVVAAMWEPLYVPLEPA